MDNNDSVNQPSVEVCSYSECQQPTVDGGDYCMKHGGAFVRRRKKLKGLRNYRLNQYQQRADQLVESEKLKDLRDEVAILRILLEERFNACGNASELILHSNSIADLVVKINTLVTSCQKLDMQLGDMLNRETVLEMADKITALLSEELDDTEMMERISAGMVEILTITDVEEKDNGLPV